MDIKKLETKTRKGFDNAMWVVILSHTWVIVYLLAGRVRAEGGLSAGGRYVIFMTIVMVLTGVMVARRLNWAIISRLLNFNRQLISLQEELTEKSKLAAITETTLNLSHEINNPLMIVRGNLEMLENDFTKEKDHDHIKDRLIKIKSHCERIRQITDKLASLSRPVEATLDGETKIFDAKRPD